MVTILLIVEELVESVLELRFMDMKLKRRILYSIVEWPNYIRKRKIYESQKQFRFVIARETWKSENKRYQEHLRHSYACNFTRPFTGSLTAAYHIRTSCHVLCKF